MAPGLGCESGRRASPHPARRHSAPAPVLAGLLFSAKAVLAPRHRRDPLAPTSLQLLSAPAAFLLRSLRPRKSCQHRCGEGATPLIESCPATTACAAGLTFGTSRLPLAPALRHRCGFHVGTPGPSGCRWPRGGLLLCSDPCCTAHPRGSARTSAPDRGPCPSAPAVQAAGAACPGVPVF